MEYRFHFAQEPNFKNLDVGKKEDNLYHIKMWPLYKTDEESFKELVLLPHDDPLVRQLIEYVHQTNCHAGTQFVLGNICERYWIPKGRKTIGTVIRRCITCRQYSSKSLPCAHLALPKDRIQEQYAFQTTGVDLTRPLLLKGGRKAWNVPYTCALLRSIY